MDSTTTGFIGLGNMGLPMALNLAKAGTPLVVWNRRRERALPLEAAGASAADDAEQVFSRCGVIFLMLADAAALDAVLDRNGPSFERRVAGRTVVHMGTTAPSHSAALGRDISGAGGIYVEAPVSGSKVPAEKGELVGILAGEAAVTDRVADLLRPVCRRTVYCGPVPSALSMKLAVNLFMVTMVTGLAEAFHFAEKSSLDPGLLREILDAGPMASAVSAIKGAKLSERDFTVQAGLADVLMNHILITGAAAFNGASLALVGASHQLYREAAEMGHGSEDMVAVVKAMEARADRCPVSPVTPS